jgi:hypothetical protein
MHPDVTDNPHHRLARAPIVLAIEGLCCVGKTTLASVSVTDYLATRTG